MARQDPNSMSSKIRAQSLRMPPAQVAKKLGCTTNLVRVVRCHMTLGRKRSLPVLSDEYFRTPSLPTYSFNKKNAG